MQSAREEWVSDTKPPAFSFDERECAGIALTHSPILRRMR